MKKIPFFNYQKLYSLEKKKFNSIFEDVCSRGAFILQKDLEHFEKNLSKFIKCKYVLGVANGTDAMWLGLLATGVKKNDEIIIPSHTYIATASAIKTVGAIPVLCDCDENGLMLADDVEKKITKKTVAIMPVQLNGMCCDMNKILRIAKKHKLKIFEDSAQGLGSWYRGKHAGTFGLFGTVSFYPSKTLGSFGDAGAFITNNKKIYDKVKVLRDHGKGNGFEVVDWGYNSRLDNLQAAILDYKLSRLNKDISHRRKIASIYWKHLKNISEIKLQRSPNYRSYIKDAYQNFEIQVEKRSKLMSYLKSKNIGTIIQWGGYPVHKFKKLKLKDKDLSKTDKFFEKCMLLPMNAALTVNEAEYICQKLKYFYENKKY